MCNIACLIDPEEIGDIKNLEKKILLGAQHADYFFVGGSTNPSQENTDKVIEKILKLKTKKYIWIFAGSPNNLPKKPTNRRAISNILIPVPINASRYEFIFKTQTFYWERLFEDFGKKKLSPMAYYIIHQNSSAGQKVKSEEFYFPSVVEFIRECGFKIFYLEGTSGNLNLNLIKEAFKIWYADRTLKGFIYGGGINTKKKLEDVCKILDKNYGGNIVVVGNKFVEVFS